MSPNVVKPLGESNATELVLANGAPARQSNMTVTLQELVDIHANFSVAVRVEKKCHLIDGPLTLMYVRACIFLIFFCVDRGLG